MFTHIAFAGKVLEHCIQKLEHYIYLLQCNITKYNQNLLKATSSATLETMTDRSYIVGELSAYLLNHKIDPHSCFVGLAPSKTVLSLIRGRYQKKQLSTVEKQREQQASSPRQYSPNTPNKEEIIATITGWAFIDDAEELMQLVRNYAAVLRGVNHFPRGTLVVVQLEAEKFQYARFVRCANQTEIEVYLDPSEGKTVAVRIDKVFPLQR